MKIPDSIRKKAEECVTKIRYRTARDGLTLCDAELLEAYFQCYRDLVAGEPDKWVLQHRESKKIHVFFGFDDISQEFLETIRVGNPDHDVVPVKLLKMEGE